MSHHAFGCIVASECTLGLSPDSAAQPSHPGSRLRSQHRFVAACCGWHWSEGAFGFGNINLKVELRSRIFQNMCVCVCVWLCVCGCVVAAMELCSADRCSNIKVHAHECSFLREAPAALGIPNLLSTFLLHPTYNILSPSEYKCIF